jgi:hypothetical protein
VCGRPRAHHRQPTLHALASAVTSLYSDRPTLPSEMASIATSSMATSSMTSTIPTAPIAAGTFIAGYGVVAASGSRTAGGVVLLIGGAWCAREWWRRRDSRTAAELVGVGLGAFIASHLLALAIGAWPSVLLVAAGMGTAAWVRADARASSPGVV